MGKKWTPPAGDTPIDNSGWTPPVGDEEVKKKPSSPVAASTSPSSGSGSKPSQVSLKNTALEDYAKHLSPDELKALSRGTQKTMASHSGDHVEDATEQQKHYEFTQTPVGKAVGAVKYLGSQATKGGIQVLKGAAHLYNTAMNTGPMGIVTSHAIDEAGNAADKVSDLGQTKGDIARIEQDGGVYNKVVSAAGMAAEFAPTVIGGEALGAPKAMLYLQGVGQGKEIADKIPDLHPLAKEALIQGSGAVNLILSDLGDTFFNNAPSALKNKITTSIAADAIKEAAGQSVTGSEFKGLLENETKTFLNKVSDGGLKAAEDYADNIKTFAKLKGATFAMHKGVDLINQADGGEAKFNETPGDLAESLMKTPEEALPFTALPAFRAISKEFVDPVEQQKSDLNDKITELDHAIQKNDSRVTNTPIDAADKEVVAERLNKEREEQNNELKKTILNQYEQQIKSDESEKLPAEKPKEDAAESKTEPAKPADEKSRNSVRNRVSDVDAPTLKEISGNLKETGEPGISEEDKYKRQYGNDDLTDEKLDNGTRTIVSRGEDGKVNGALEISYNGKDGEQKEPVSVKVVVDENNRRKGIATNLFRHAEEQGIDLSDVRGKETTDAGQALYEANKNLSPKEADKRDIEKETDPKAIASRYHSEESAANYKEQGVIDYLGNGKINEKDYKRWGDRNGLGDHTDPKMLRWVDSTNSSKTDLAKDAEILSDQLGVAVTPEDFINVIDKYKGRDHFNEESKTDTQRALEKRYEELTGNKLTPKRAESAWHEVHNIKPLSLTEKQNFNQVAKNYDLTEEDYDKYFEHIAAGHAGNDGRNAETASDKVSEPENEQTVGKNDNEKSNSSQKRQSLSDSELSRKLELRKKFAGRFNDVTGIPALLADKEFREYAGLVFKEAAGDFKAFSKELIDNVGEKIKEHLPGFFRELVDAVDNPFKESKIQRVLYHGSDEQINEFKPSDKGIYFSEDKDYWPQKKYIYSAHIDAKKPEYRNSSFIEKKPENSDSIVWTKKDALDFFKDDVAQTKEGKEKLERLKNINEIYEAVVFHPNQINIIGSEKRDNFENKSSPNSEQEIVEQPQRGADDSKGPIGIRNDDVSEERGKAVDRTHKSREQTDAEGKRLVDSGELNPDEFAKKIIENPYPASTEEQAALRYHKVNLEKEQRSLSKEPSTENQAKYALNEERLEKNRKATEIIGNENARALGDRQGAMAEDYSRVHILERAKMANGGELDPKDEKELTERTARIKDLEDKLAEREEQIRKLHEEGTVDKVKRTAEREEREAKRQITKLSLRKEREGLVAELHQIARKSMSSAGANKIPVEMLPTLAKLARNYVLDGAITISSVADKIYNDLKDHLDDLDKGEIEKVIKDNFNDYLSDRNKVRLERSKALQQKKLENLQSGNYEKKVYSKIQVDNDYLAIRAKINREQMLINKKIEDIQNSKKSAGRKIVDFTVKYGRQAKLASVTVLGKLSAAGLSTVTLKPLTEGVGKGMSAVFKKIADKSIVEGSVSREAMKEAATITGSVDGFAKAYARAATQGMKDAYDELNIKKGGQSDLSALYKDSRKHLPAEAAEFLGHVHSAIKAPIKRFTWEHSYAKRVAKGIQAGLDITDPVIDARNRLEAYKDANRAIFMGDNWLAGQYENVTGAAEKSELASVRNVGAIARILFPFVKVPSNIVLETGRYAFGLIPGISKVAQTTASDLANRAGAQKLASIIHTGIGELTPEESDIVLRNLKKGTVGGAALALGFFNPKNVGGYYQEREKRKKNEASADAFKIGDTKIPMWMTEHPIFQAMQVGATFRRLLDKNLHKDDKYETATLGVISGISENIPLAEGAKQITQAIGSNNRFNKYVSSVIKGEIEPSALNQLATITDTKDGSAFTFNPDNQNKRKPNNKHGLARYLKEELETGVPGLRENVKK